nr:hypothetical protein BgiMline_028719 [Biomphalaria glabrata]
MSRYGSYDKQTEGHTTSLKVTPGEKVGEWSHKAAEIIDWYTSTNTVSYIRRERNFNRTGSQVTAVVNIVFIPRQAFTTEEVIEC